MVKEVGLSLQKRVVDTYAILVYECPPTCISMCKVFIGKKVMCFHSNAMPTVIRHWYCMNQIDPRIPQCVFIATGNVICVVIMYSSWSDTAFE